MEGDLNVSGLSIPWTAQHLMVEVTGRRWTVESVPNRADLCLNGVSWPSPTAIQVMPEEVVVCMGQR